MTVIISRHCILIFQYSLLYSLAYCHYRENGSTVSIGLETSLITSSFAEGSSVIHLRSGLNVTGHNHRHQCADLVLGFVTDGSRRNSERDPLDKIHVHIEFGGWNTARHSELAEGVPTRRATPPLQY